MRLWTLKEAYVKALGTGIAAHPFARFDVSMTPSNDETEPVERVELRERSACPGSSGEDEDEDEDDDRDAHSRDAETKRRDDWSLSARGWRFTLIRVKRGEGLICAVCAWAGLPGLDGDALTARRSAGSVSVRWTVPLLGDLEPEAKPPPEMVAASAR
jgi:4'-phosphopantetheinyl transferase